MSDSPDLDHDNSNQDKISITVPVYPHISISKDNIDEIFKLLGEFVSDNIVSSPDDYMEMIGNSLKSFFISYIKILSSSSKDDIFYSSFLDFILINNNIHNDLVIVFSYLITVEEDTEVKEFIKDLPSHIKDKILYDINTHTANGLPLIVNSMYHVFNDLIKMMSDFTSDSIVNFTFKKLVLKYHYILSNPEFQKLLDSLKKKKDTPIQKVVGDGNMEFTVTRKVTTLRVKNILEFNMEIKDVIEFIKLQANLKETEINNIIGQILINILHNISSYDMKIIWEEVDKSGINNNISRYIKGVIKYLRSINHDDLVEKLFSGITERKRAIFSEHNWLELPSNNNSFSIIGFIDFIVDLYLENKIISLNYADVIIEGMAETCKRYAEKNPPTVA